MSHHSNIDHRHIELDREDDRVKQFVLSLKLEAQGSILEVDGEPVARVLPVERAGDTVDPAKLKAAILARRDLSRVLNGDWAESDRAAWEHLPPA